METIIKKLCENLTDDCINFDLIDENGNVIEDTIKLLISKIDGIIYLNIKCLKYNIEVNDNIHSVRTYKEKTTAANAHFSEICTIEIVNFNNEKEYIFVYANLIDTDMDTEEVVSWEISQYPYANRNQNVWFLN